MKRRVDQIRAKEAGIKTKEDRGRRQDRTGQDARNWIVAKQR